MSLLEISSTFQGNKIWFAVHFLKILSIQRVINMFINNFYFNQVYKLRTNILVDMGYRYGCSLALPFLKSFSSLCNYPLNQRFFHTHLASLWLCWYFEVLRTPVPNTTSYRVFMMNRQKSMLPSLGGYWYSLEP